MDQGAATRLRADELKAAELVQIRDGLKRFGRPIDGN